MRVSFGYGVSAVQSSFSKVSRNDPPNALLPDLVIAFTTPPPKRPNSAETAAVVVVVSCSASSMNRLSGVLRMLSCTTTPLIMNRFWNDMAPEMAMAPEGPDTWTPGVRIAADWKVRASGSASTSSCLKFVETCAFCPKSATSPR